MSGEFRKINVNDIINYYENPRHAVGQTEEDTLKKLFDAVGTQYMLNLASDIQKHGLLPSQLIVVVFSKELKKYVVYEGNRRIAAIKLLLYPDSFAFLDRTIVEKAKKIGASPNVTDLINCYVTDEEDAFFIMERVHSGEDKGRGTKQWTSREKDSFKVRRNHKKTVSYLIDYYIRKHFDGFDITTVLPFTTIQRIFNNRDVRKAIGLDLSDESTFNFFRMKLVLEASKWIATEADSSGIAVTRFFNRADEIKSKMLPWIEEYVQGKDEATFVPVSSQQHQPVNSDNSSGGGEGPLCSESSSHNNTDDGTTTSDSERNIPETGSQNDGSEDTENDEHRDADENGYLGTRSGGTRNLPYFFQGLGYGSLDPNDPQTHGVTAIGRELQLFSDKRLVSTYPIASTFLVRSLIEQTFIYHSKKHKIQGQDKLIWEEIKNITKLSRIISQYKKNLPNYITDSTMRQYFNNLFDNYEDSVDPLNWVVHRPAEYQLSSSALEELPRKGLLALINYMLS